MAKYSNYNNVFSAENVAELPEHTRINEYITKLKKDKQPSFESIYSLKPIELETLKTYIETNLANKFICLFKSPAKALILFDWKPDKSLQLCINYQDLNSLTSKNQYCLLLIDELLNWLG